MNSFNNVDISKFDAAEKIQVQDFYNKVKRIDLVNNQKRESIIFVVESVVFIILAFILLATSGFYNSTVDTIFPLSWSTTHAIDIQSWLLVAIGIICTIQFFSVCMLKDNVRSLLNSSTIIGGIFYLVYIWFFIGIFITGMVEAGVAKPIFGLILLSDLGSGISATVLSIFIQYYCVIFFISAMSIAVCRYFVAKACEKYLLSVNVPSNFNLTYSKWFPEYDRINEIFDKHSKLEAKARVDAWHAAHDKPYVYDANNQPNTQTNMDKGPFADFMNTYKDYGRTQPEVKTEPVNDPVSTHTTSEPTKKSNPNDAPININITINQYDKKDDNDSQDVTYTIHRNR